MILGTMALMFNEEKDYRVYLAVLVGVGFMAVFGATLDAFKAPAPR